MAVTEEIIYNTELCLKVDGKLIPIFNLSYEVATPKRRIHVIHKHNFGFHHLPKEFAFTVRLYESGAGKEAKDMLLLALQDKIFSVVVASYNGQDWTYQSLGFNRCAINRLSGSAFAPDQVPEDTIECYCLEFNVDAAESYGSH